LGIEAAGMDQAMRVVAKHAAANYRQHLGFAVEARGDDTDEWGQAAGRQAGAHGQ
jgi:hypothetical protein